MFHISLNNKLHPRCLSVCDLVSVLIHIAQSVCDLVSVLHPHCLVSLRSGFGASSSLISQSAIWFRCFILIA